MTLFETLSPGLQRRLKRSSAKLRAAIAECYGADSPLLTLFSNTSELTPGQLAEGMLSGQVKLPDVELTPELKRVFGFFDGPPENTPSQAAISGPSGNTSGNIGPDSAENEESPTTISDCQALPYVSEGDGNRTRNHRIDSPVL